MSVFNRLLCSGVLVAAAAGSIVFAQAQEAAPAAAPESSAKAAESGQLQEITVTAMHRTEDLRKVPMSISALSNDEMKEMGIKNIRDIAAVVPGLNFQDSEGDPFGTTQIAIRGIVADTGSATTGVYINDTPVMIRLSSATGTNNPYPQLFDLDRVEVLKGPQGTLFGADSEGGAVRFITPEPDLDEYSGDEHVDLGDTVGGDPSYEVGLSAGGPIVEDKLGFRASAYFQHVGGYVDRTDDTTNDVTAPNSNWQRTESFRLDLKYQATDELTIEPSLFWQDQYTNDTSMWMLSEPCTDVSAHCEVPTVGGPYKNLEQQQQPDDDKWWLADLSVAYKFDAFTVKSDTALLHRTDNRITDGSDYDLSGIVPWPTNQPCCDYFPYSGTPGGQYLPGGAPFVSTYWSQNDQQNYTEEVRFTSNNQPGDRFSWIVGFFGWRARWEQDQMEYDPLNAVANDPVVHADYGEVIPCKIGTCTVVNLMGTDFLGSDLAYIDNSITHDTEESVYATGTYNIADNLKFEAGIRASRAVFDYEIYENGPWNAHPVNPVTGGFPYTAESTNSATDKGYPVTPRFSLSYQLNDNQMIYGTIAKGYRIGGGNEVLGDIASCAKTDFPLLGIKSNPLTYGADTDWQYEVGTKATLFDKKVEVEAAIYWINWNNIQSLVTLPYCGYSYTANLGDDVERGGEISAQWVVNSWLKLDANAGYTDARGTSTEFAGPNAVGTLPLFHVGDTEGVAPFTFVLSAEPHEDLGNGLNLYGRVDYEFSSHYNRDGLNIADFEYFPDDHEGAALSQVNVRVGLTKGPWDVSLYVENLFNTGTLTDIYQDEAASPNLRVVSQRPLTAGLTADYSF